jgi:hypothetical protein
MEVPVIPIVILLIFGVIGLVLYLRMVRVLELKGYPSSSDNLFFVKPSDYRNFMKVIKDESDGREKLRYQLILWTQIVLVVAYIPTMLLMLRLEIAP